MRRIVLLALVAGAVVLVTATYVSARRTSASATWNIGSSGTYSLGGDGSCQTVGGDFSVSIAAKGEYFHLIWTPKGHGNYRTVAWRWTYVTHDAVIGATITFADGRKSGTFAGLSTKGVRVTGSFKCG